MLGTRLNNSLGCGLGGFLILGASLGFAADTPSYKKISLSDDGTQWVSLGGHVRARSETWQNLGFNDNNDDSFALIRATLHADWHLGDKWRVFSEIKSANASERDLPGGKRSLDVDTLALQQFYVDYQTSAALRIRLGRQALSLGKQRLVSPLPWGNTLRTWDGIRLDYQQDKWQLQAFATQFVPVQQYEFNQADRQQSFNGIQLSHKLGDWSSEHYLLNLSDGEQQNLQTLGTHWSTKNASSNTDLEFAVQFGDTKADLEQTAFMLGVKHERLLQHDLVNSVFVGFDYASGDDDASDGDSQTFNQLYPLGHAYLGFADHIGRKNIMALNLGAKFKFTPKLSAQLTLHRFYKAEKNDAVYNAGGGVLRPVQPGNNDTFIADEIDWVMNYKLSQQLKLQLGLIYLLAGDVIESSANDEDVSFAYAQLNYTF